MKNKLSLLFLAMIVSGTALADVQPNVENKVDNSVKVQESKPVTIEELIKKDPAIFKNEPLSDISAARQKEELIKLNEKYFAINNYPEDELNELFVSFISLGHNEAADAILNNKNVKIDVNKYDKGGRTPLMAAAFAGIQGGNVEYAKKLVDLGADVNLGTVKADYTPISMAATVNNYKVVAYLILKGALFMKKDKLDYMPIDYAMRNNSVQSAKIIQQALSVKLKEINGA